MKKVMDLQTLQENDLKNYQKIMELKKAKVSRLPTNDIGADICQYIDLGRLAYRSSELAYHQNYHIYITSDEEVKEGDWCVKGNELGKIVKGMYELRLIINKVSFNFDHHKLFRRKVIASNDPLLKLPEPSQDFIKKYVAEDNKGNVIEDILVEYVELTNWRGEERYVESTHPKINENNTIECQIIN